jgi:hypothetical protein
VCEIWKQRRSATEEYDVRCADDAWEDRKNWVRKREKEQRMHARSWLAGVVRGEPCNVLINQRKTEDGERRTRWC